MPVSQRSQHTMFTTVRSEGAILPMDLLQRIALLDATLDGLTPDNYHLLGTEKLNEAINHAWNHLLGAWVTFKSAREKLPERDSGTTLTRERWLLPMFSELGYGRLLTAKPLEINEQSYPISHGWQHTPIHLVSCKFDLDHAGRNAAGSLRTSPHSLVQEVLNRSENSLWGFVSNGLQLRVLRNNVSLTRQAYVEFDLEAMMNGEVYADFVLLWLLCHQSRVEAERPADCWLERWSRTAHQEGTRALEQLRIGVEKAITALGSGFLAHRANTRLKERLRSGKLDTQDYYRQLLRLVYRLIVLFVAEDRGVLFHPDAGELTRTRYTQYYSTARLRKLAERRIGTRHADLFAGLRLVMEKLGEDGGCPELGLPAWNSFLFSREAVADIVDCELANHDLLDTMRSLAFTDHRQIRRAVDYRNLGSEELGSVYESLLELHPVLHIEAAKFELTTASGHERKTTGSYYTPTSLINCLLDSALDPVLEEACAKPDPEQAILDLKVCDPACGSGHFLIAAAHRIAKQLAAVRTGVEEPAPPAQRKALRDVVGRCIYGVDINPMSVELCKVSLWMEAIEPGKPLSFLDAHIQCGNSLLGATPALLRQGIPDSAFEPIEGDNRTLCREYKRRNSKERTGQLSLINLSGKPWERLGDLASGMIQLDAMGDDTAEEIRRKQDHYNKLLQTNDYLFGRLWADAWCAAFVWKKTDDFDFPITEEVFRKIEQNPYSIAPWMRDEIKRLADQYQFFHWHLAFPDVFHVPNRDEQPENEQAGWSGGFDIVLGNPPWERIKIQEKEWFAERLPDIANAANAAQRRRMIAALTSEDPTLYAAFMEDQRQATGESHFVRASSRYPLCGRGDVNTYAVFTENMRLVLNPIGRVGCIVPSGIASDDTTKTFFQNLMHSKSLVSLYDFENRLNIFPGVGHGRSRFCLLTLTGSSRPITQGAEFVFFACSTDDLNEEGRHFILSEEDILLFNPNTLTCPIFRSKRDMALTKSIYNLVPILFSERDSKGNPWKISFLRMFDMANDSHLFYSCKELVANGWHLEGNVFYKEEDKKCLPLYESKMIWQYDHRLGSFAGFNIRPENSHLPPSSVANHEDCFYLPLSWYWVSEDQLQTRVHNFLNPTNSNSAQKWLLVYRFSTSPTNERTMVCSVIPMLGTNHILPCMFLNISSQLQVCFLGNANSFAYDYLLRNKMGRLWWPTLSRHQNRLK
jgi:hypothetical protein